MTNELSPSDIKRLFKYNSLMSENCALRSKLNSANLELNNLRKKQEQIINKEVRLKTESLNKELKNKDKIIEDKDKQIEALKYELAKLKSQTDNDSSNSGLPTSKTSIGKKKYIPNTREKTDKKQGGQKGHAKHKLIPFNKNEITEEKIILPTECNKCHSKNIEVLETSVEKQELDYDVVLIKRNNKFSNCRCKDCDNIFHADIPNDLKEPIQYGKTLQSLAVCLTNEIYTPFNKTVKLISGITNNNINMSEGYVVKLQKRASEKLESFKKELEKYIIKSPIYGWDDGIVQINKKDGILRVYCTDEVVLLIGHENKNKDGIIEDGILPNTKESTIVMHDHIIHNYNENYKFDNVECVIHLIRRLKKMKNNTNHDWCDKLVQLLSQTNKDRNQLIKEEKDKFNDQYLQEFETKFNEIIFDAKKQNKEPITINYFKNEEEKFIKDIIKYKRNYLLWIYNFSLPSTNNNSEKNIRPIKSKLKISGQFQNINYAKYYATIRSYIETCKKHGINIIEACERLMNDNPYTLDEILKKDKETSTL